MKFVHYKNIVVALGLVFLIAVPTATAAPKATIFQVSTLVTASCSINTTGVLTIADFTQTESTAYIYNVFTIKPTCSKGTQYSVTIGNGLWGDGIVRKLKGSTFGDFLQYHILKNSRSVEIAPGGLLVSATGDGFGGEDQSIQIETQVDTAQRASPDSYSDTIQISIIY